MSVIQVRRDVIANEVRRSFLSNCVPAFKTVNRFNQARFHEVWCPPFDSRIWYSIVESLRVDLNSLQAQSNSCMFKELKNGIIALSHPLWPPSHLVQKQSPYSIITPVDDYSYPCEYHNDPFRGQILLHSTVSGRIPRNSRGPEAQLSVGPIKNGLDAGTSVRVDSREIGTKAMLANEFGVLESPRTGVASTIEHYPHALAGGDR